MSVSRIMQQAAAGVAGGAATYVDDVFSTYLYDGTGSAQTITNGIDLAGEGGLVWIKDRQNSRDHALHDTERGINRYLNSNQVYVETQSGTVSSYNADGFSMSTGNAAVNGSGIDYASWSFRKQPGFFDVVTYTGDGTAGREIAHNLGSTPGMMIVKCINDSSSWAVYHRSLGATKALLLDTTASAYTFSSYWNDTEPTDSVFTLGTGWNTNNLNFVMYLFAHDAQDFGTDSDESIIKCGSYTGDGTSDLSKEINLGWEPQFLMIKPTSYAGDGWFMFDTMRGIVTGGNEARLYANDSGSENAFNNYLVLTPTGFAFDRAALNTSSAEYIYMAIRRPHKPASEFAATELFAVDELSVSTTPNFESGFPVDFAINRQPVGGTSNWNVGARLIQGRRLFTNLTDAESAESNNQFDYQDGYGGANLTNYLGYMFRRAPGFFDVVTYTGNGSSSRTISHNLGVAPEMMIFKCRTNTNGWVVYHASLGPNYGAILQSNSLPIYAGTFFNSTNPTSSVFTIGSASATNQNTIPIISYHFATAPGISKVGSYTGTGSDVNVNCGFTSGARFVLVKRTDAGGDWYLWDSERGIVAGNDPYFLLNSSAAQVTSTDYIDPLSSGFTVTSTAPAALNASGGTYIFLAIA